MALLPARNILDGTKSPATTTSEAKTAFGLLRDFLSDLLGTDSSDKAAARSALGVALTAGVTGLNGIVNAGVPLTRFDLSATQVVLTDANGGAVVRKSASTFTCNLAAAGPVVNGRDQSAVFPANSWIYLYFIWNPTTSTLATIASLTAPSAFTGTTLPAGYTHWAYATTIRWNASSNILDVIVRGSNVMYNLPSSSANTLLSSGIALTFTTISCSAWVPPNALQGLFDFRLSLADSRISGWQFAVRTTGQTHAGFEMCQGVTAGSPAIHTSSVNTRYFPLSASQQLDYKLVGPSAPDTGSGGCYMVVQGYTVPNGDN